MPDYIFNTTALSHFASVNRSDLLETLYRNTAFTTLEVSDELYRGVKAGYSYLNAALQQIRSVNPNGWLPVLTPESSAEYMICVTNSIRFSIPARHPVWHWLFHAS